MDSQSPIPPDEHVDSRSADEAAGSRQAVRNLDETAAYSGEGRSAEDHAVRIPEQFHRYRIVKRLGQGGMGSVFLAEDTRLGRQVALKVPHFDDDSNPEVIARFYREARSAATLNHPNLCAVHDVGEFNGMPYLTMAYIKGRPLSEILATGQKISTRSAAKLVRTLALALQEAHAKGITHRDLKPDNIMLDDRQQPVIMDFGLARRGDAQDARVTKTGMVIGTPMYMAPEQVRGEYDAIGPAADIYALGVILYELLTGSPPFDGGAMSVLSRVLTEQPAPATERRPELDPDLSAICSRAMAKNPEDRFASMTEFAESLSRYLRKKATLQDHEACQARSTLPASPSSAASDYTPTVPVETPPAEPTITPSRRRERPMNRRLFFGGIAAAVGVAIVVAAVAILTRRNGNENGPKNPSSPTSSGQRPPAEDTVTNVIETHAGGINHLEFTPDGKFIVASDGESVRIWNTKTGRQERQFTEHPAQVRRFDISNDGGLLATACTNGLVELFEFPSGQLLNTLQGHTDLVFDVAFTPDAKRILSAGMDGSVRVWDVKTGQLIRRLLGHESWVRSVAVSADGRLAVSTGNDLRVIVWNLKTLRPEQEAFIAHKEVATCVEFVGETKQVVTTGYDKALRYWDLNSPTQPLIRTMTGHTAPIRMACVTADGRFAITCSSDETTARMWHLKTGKDVHRFAGTHPHRAIAVTPDGRILASADKNGRIHLLRIPRIAIQDNDESRAKLVSR